MPDAPPPDARPPESAELAELAADRRAERAVTYKGVAAAALTAVVLWVRQRYLL